MQERQLPVYQLDRDSREPQERLARFTDTEPLRGGHRWTDQPVGVLCGVEVEDLEKRALVRRLAGVVELGQTTPQARALYDSTVRRVNRKQCVSVQHQNRS